MIRKIGATWVVYRKGWERVAAYGTRAQAEIREMEILGIRRRSPASIEHLGLMIVASGGKLLQEDGSVILQEDGAAVLHG
jgi:hypothetical protein